MPPHKKNGAAASLPPPPRPDPVTLDQIYERLTAPGVMMEERAYHLVALSTVVFHPSVKLFLFEHTPLHDPVIGGSNSNNEQAASTTTCTRVLEENKKRRENVLKNIAFFLAQRNSAVVQECRWETVALLGELCRLESPNPSARQGGSGVSLITSATPSSSSVSLYQEVVQKLNHYARANLEFLAQLPWFVPAVRELLGKDTVPLLSTTETTTTGGDSGEKAGAEGSTLSLSSSPSPSSAIRQVLRHRDNRGGRAASYKYDEGIQERDNDVCIALKDILAALPEVKCSNNSVSADSEDGDHNFNNNEVTIVWTADNVSQAHDLMFLDASTSLLHLIPLVSRTSDLRCTNCEKPCNKNNNNDCKSVNSLLRCSSCKAVYYCSETCQRAHWTSAHRVPCKSYKQRADDIMAQYEAANKIHSGNMSKKKLRRHQEDLVTVLEVPLEPSLFYETRRYLYDHRDVSFSDVSFVDYFMKYTVRGS